MARRRRESRTAEDTRDGRPVVLIELRDGDADSWAVVDAEEWPRVHAVSPVWGLPGRGYPRAFVRREDGSRGAVNLSRVIARPAQGQRVRHLNGDPLDCRSCNVVAGDKAPPPDPNRRRRRRRQRRAEATKPAPDPIREQLLREAAEAQGRTEGFKDDL